MSALDHDPTDLDGQQARQEQGVRESAEQQAQEARDYAWLMGSPAGRRILWQILSEAGVYRVSMAPDPYQTAFKEGRRDIGLRVLTRINQHAPEQFAAMQREVK